MVPIMPHKQYHIVIFGVKGREMYIQHFHWNIVYGQVADVIYTKWKYGEYGS